ncbi:hypothetical protein WME94_41780 [Sorangium sp. So ce429]
MRRLLYSPILALVLLLECPISAAAEPPLPRRPAPTKAEQDLQEQARRLVNEGRIADARDVHLTLWRLTGSASDAFNVGMLSFRLHEFATAAEFLTIYFDRVGTPEAPKIWVPPGFKDNYELARANFAEARRHIGALEVRVSESGADVLVDGRQVGVSPLTSPVFVAPGQLVRANAAADGRQQAHRRVLAMSSGGCPGGARPATRSRPPTGMSRP